MTSKAYSSEISPDGGQIVSMTIEGGKDIRIHFPPELLKLVIGLFEASFARELKETPRDALILTCIAAGIAQIGTDVQLSLSTVETGSTVLVADDAMLQSLKNQVDRAISLRAGHSTMQ